MTRSELLEVAKPILFNTEMVKAILDGRKTQTRRVIKFKNINSIDATQCIDYNFRACNEIGIVTEELKPYYKIGDILYIRETFNDEGWKTKNLLLFKADIEEKYLKSYWWIPSIHMPKKYARIFLKVTNVKVEMLKKLSVIDAISEGCPHEYSNGITGTKRKVFEWWTNLWNSTAPDGYKWEDNPYVFVYEFERVEATE